MATKMGLSRTGEVWGSHYVHGIDLKDLPCGGCSYCTRAHTQWSSFIEDIDDVIPIANCQKASLAAAGETKWLTTLLILNTALYKSTRHSRKL